MGRTIRVISIITASFVIAIGLFSLFMTIFLYDHYKNFVCIMAAIGVIVFEMFYLIIVFNNMQVHSKYIVFFIFGIIDVVLACLFIWLHNYMGLTIALCASLAATSVIKIILSPSMLSQIKFELPAFLVAYILLFNVIDAAFFLMLILASSAMMLFGILYLVYVCTPLYSRRRRKKYNSINVKVSNETIVKED